MIGWLLTLYEIHGGNFKLRGHLTSSVPCNDSKSLKTISNAVETFSASTDSPVNTAQRIICSFHQTCFSVNAAWEFFEEKRQSFNKKSE
jgi:hypothetical protein